MKCQRRKKDVPSDDEQALYQADQQELKKQYWNDVYQSMSDEENTKTTNSNRS